MLKELAADLDIPLKSLENLANYAVEDGRLLQVSSELCMTPEALEELRGSAGKLLNERGAATVAEFRDCWAMTRKHALPCLEYFDRHDITVRQGDQRTAGPLLNEPLVATNEDG